MPDRWVIKGTNPDVKAQFDELRQKYDQQFDEEITQQRTLKLLMEGVDVRTDPDTQEILNKLDGLDDDIADSLASRFGGGGL